MAAVFGFDAYSPAEIARRVGDVGVAKAQLPIASTAMLGVLAGAFIALGSLYYTLVASDATLGFAATRVLGGLVFSTGLVLVVVAGGELFTGNNLIAMAWAGGVVSTGALLRNWAIALAANAAGALAIALLVLATAYPQMNGGAVGCDGGQDRRGATSCRLRSATSSAAASSSRWSTTSSTGAGRRVPGARKSRRPDRGLMRRARSRQGRCAGPET